MNENDKERRVTVIPATKKTVYLDKQMFATIVTMIPAGKLTTEENIFDMWAKRKGGDCCEFESCGILPVDKRVLWQPADVQRVDFITDLKSYGGDDKENLIPYWRIISQNGTLVDFGRICDKETQKTMLEREGHVIVQPNPDRRLYRVQDYKAALFDLDRLIINE